MPHLLTADDPILIVGAGPAGYVAAIELRRRGLPVQIIDKQPGPSTATRAITVHASALGHLRAAGLDEEFMAHGIPAESMDYHFLGESGVPRLRYETLSYTRYPFVLIIGQDKVEEILRRHLESLGCHVQWGTELVGLDSRESAAAVTAHVVSPTGMQVLHPQWVLGCDGVHSKVRELAGIGWEGTAYPSSQRMTDARLVGLDRVLPTNRIHYLLGDGRLLFLCKLPGPNTRLIISDLNKQGHRPDLTPQAFQNALDEHFNGQVQLAGCTPPHEFALSQRIATHFIDPSGRILLLGDATGTHSVAGGLGFNRSVEDGWNAGWKVAMVAKGYARRSLLDTYEVERRPAAERIGDTAHLIHRIIMEHDKPFAERFEIAERLNATGAVQRISGLANSYRDVIPSPAGLTRLDGLAAGDRAPDLHDLFSHPDYTLLALQAHPHSTVGAGIDQLTAPYRHLLRTAVITPHEIRAYGQVTHADLRTVHQVYGQPDIDTLCLVRPDGYISLRCRADELNAMDATLKSAMLT